MNTSFAKAFSQLTGTQLNAVMRGPTTGATRLGFSDGTVVSAAFWRGLKNGRPEVSGFEDGRNSGSEKPIRAVEELANAVTGGTVTRAHFDAGTGDLMIRLETGFEIQVFNFTGDEDWEVRFADGTGDFSNLVLGEW